MTELFQYDGFEIPLDLVMLTGGGPDTWHDISIGHMGEYQKYCPIEPYHNVLEVGCGVGRDAIQLANVIKPPGSYTGIDIIRPSIEWCQANVTARYPHFQFVSIDVESQIHNPGGTVQVTEVTLPLPDASTDRIILQSVFTHMFERDIVHYLHEFRRILRPGGKVFASFFLLDEESLKMAINTGQSLTFEHPYGDGCAINDPQYPEGAVGYFKPALDRILANGRFELDQAIHRGFWSGRQGVEDGQDIAVMCPLPLSFGEKVRRSLRRSIRRAPVHPRR